MAATKKPVARPKATKLAPKPTIKPKAPAKRPAAAREPEIVNPRTMSPTDKYNYYERQKAYERSQGLTPPKKKK